MTWKYTSDILDSDLMRLEIFSVAVGCDPFDAAGTWMSESGLFTKAHNINGDASGIFQAMPATLKGMGYRPELGDNDSARAAAFRAESFQVQIRWAQRYYTPYKGKLKNKAAFYVATFLPADIDYAMSGTADTVLVQKDGRRGWAYSANAGFDENHDLKITVGELEDAIDRACRGPRWEEFNERLSAQLKITPLNVVQPFPYDLGTVLGLQEALLKIGWNPGPLDGVPGPLTRSALMGYQKSRGLQVDGIMGPNSRASIIKDLAALGIAAS